MADLSDARTILPATGPDAENALRKRWRRIVPAAFITYSLAYLDRVNYGFGAGDIGKELRLTPAQSASLAAVFFVGYLVFQIPGSSYAQRGRGVRVVFWALLAWGALASAMGFIHTFAMLALDRFFLGAAESVVIPSMLVLFMTWFTPSERSKANAMLILGNPLTIVWMSAMTGFLVQRWGWRLTFIVEGLPSILWAFVWLRTVPETPTTASWMTQTARERLEQQISIQTKPGGVSMRFWEVLRNANVLLLCLQFCLWSAGLYGLVLWLPSILRNRTAAQMQWVGLLSAFPYLLAATAMVLVSRSRGAGKNRQRIVANMLWMAAGGMFLASIFIRNSPGLAYGSLVIAAIGLYAPYGPFWASVPDTLSKAQLGKAVGMINACGAIGAALGSWMVGELNERTGNPNAGLSFLACVLVLAGALMFPLSQRADRDSMMPFGNAPDGAASEALPDV